MKITMTPWDARWRERFDAEAARLRERTSTPLTIEHVGSTSVEGLMAKPIVDILVGVEQLEQLDEVAAALSGLPGYVYMQAYEEYVPERRYFVVLDAERSPRTVEVLDWSDEIDLDARRCQVHVVLEGCHYWNELLRFRELLRSDVRARSRYAEHKRRLSTREWPDSRTYAWEKDALIAELMSA